MYHNSRRTVLFPTLLALGIVCGLLTGRLMERMSAKSQLTELLTRRAALPENKLTHTLALIGAQYVDPVDLDSLGEAVIPSLLAQLDPHSVYIPKEEMEAVNEPLEGEFDGIGVVFNMATDTVIVLNVVPSGPSFRAGVQNGDRIIRINDSLVAGQKIPQNDIVRMLRGKRGTQVRLSLQRQQIDAPVEVTVTRDVIPLKSLDAAFMLRAGTGYMKLSKFSRTTYTEVMQALASLRAQGMERLVLDLRGNSGGYLDQAILLANEFLGPDKLIVYTKGRDGEQVREYSDGKGASSDLALAVLIDEASASSSEILAGALQDNDRGTIIGRRSFGKGLVQRQIPYRDGSALRLTVARYYTPTGRSIQKPYVHGDEQAYQSELYDRYMHNELFTADSIRFDDSLRYYTPKGKAVYGGGGIMPDEFVPLDTTDVSRYFIEVSGRNILYRYTIDYADRHRRELNAVQTLDELEALLDADSDLLEDFVAYAARNGVPPDRKGIALSRELLVAQLRAFIGRNTSLEDAGFYANIYPIDSVMVRAVELLDAQQQAQRPDNTPLP